MVSARVAMKEVLHHWQLRLMWPCQSLWMGTQQAAQAVLQEKYLVIRNELEEIGGQRAFASDLSVRNSCTTEQLLQVFKRIGGPKPASDRHSVLMIGDGERTRRNADRINYRTKAPELGFGFNLSQGYSHPALSECEPGHIGRRGAGLVWRPSRYSSLTSARREWRVLFCPRSKKDSDKPQIESRCVLLETCESSRLGVVCRC